MAETEKDIYTIKQAMERLGIKSSGAFRHLQKKYPEFFVLVAERNKSKHFDKATIDKFADMCDQLRHLHK
jgi:hypothetical protein